mgnify:CR=1 FL=1
MHRIDVHVSHRSWGQLRRSSSISPHPCSCMKKKKNIFPSSFRPALMSDVASQFPIPQSLRETVPLYGQFPKRAWFCGPAGRGADVVGPDPQTRAHQIGDRGVARRPNGRRRVSIVGTSNRQAEMNESAAGEKRLPLKNVTAQRC